MVHPTVRAVPIDFPLSTDLFCVDPAALAGHRGSSVSKPEIIKRTMAKSIADEAVAERDRHWSALMVAAQAGDSAAYEELLRHCVPFIKNVARRRSIAADRTDDVVQDVLLTIHRARHTYDPSRSFIGWLRVIADRRANKTQIRKAVEDLFKVNVLKVNTLNIRGKYRRQRTAQAGQTSDWKKALVTLKEGEKISLV